jgi:hypothetical protein
MTQRIDVADAVAVEGDADEVSRPVEALCANRKIAGVDHVV